MKMYQSAASMFKNKKVLILGFGREGMSTYRFLRNMYPDMHLTIADKNEIKLDDKKRHAHLRRQLYGQLK